MRILCVSYRGWALDIYDNLAKKSNNTFLIVRNKEQYSEQLIIDFKPDYILYYGWSWIIPENIINNYKCIMLHPSSLPKYRGGSPIQNQIIAGEKISAVTLFLMNNEMDSGGIIAQKEFALSGTLASILSRISKIGYELTLNYLINRKKISTTPQDESEATYCKRRRPNQSEITIEELTTKPAEYIYNKISCLKLLK